MLDDAVWDDIEEVEAEHDEPTSHEPDPGPTTTPGGLTRTRRRRAGEPAVAVLASVMEGRVFFYGGRQRGA
jgi:hypothetical protein